MAEKLTIDFSLPMPLFPLPACVLLPHASIPLRVFEHRYRAMVADALDGPRLIAMAVFEGSDWKADYQGNPPLRPTVCLGHILRHQQLPNGHYDIILQGVCRARILNEVEHEPYRQAMLEPLDEHPPLEIDLSDHRGKLESLLHDKRLKRLAAVSAIHHWLSEEVPTAAMIDLATMHLCEDGEDRYRMLAESDAQTRAAWLERQLIHTRQTLAMAERYPQKSLEDYVFLN